MTTLTQLQQELTPWQEHNFPGRQSWEPLLGVCEETGELHHAFLKRHQGIRGTPEEHRAAIEDAVGDIVVFLADFCNAEGIVMQDALDACWATVKQRDWRPV